MLKNAFKLIFAVLVLTVFSFTNESSAQRLSSAKIPAAQCKEFPGSIFKPCICASKVPKTVKYRPSLKECGGDAAAILSGNFLNSYSVVLRDSQNRDRWPASGYNGCSSAEVENGLSKCSAFKCQKIIKTNSSSAHDGAQQICCFGEAGTNPILEGATRLTIKLKDIPNSTADPLVRACLSGFDADKRLN